MSSKSEREDILKFLETDLMKIQTANGYNIDLKSVVRGQVNLDDVTGDLPLACIFFNDEGRETPFEKPNAFRATVELVVVVHCEVQSNSSVSLNDYCEGVVTDLLHYFNQNSEKAKIVVCDFNSLKIPMNWFVSRVNSRIDYNTDKTKQSAGVAISIKYVDESRPRIIDISVLPSVPALSLPADGANVTTLKPELNWSSVDCLGYELQISTNNVFGSLIVNQIFLQNSSFTIPLDVTLSNGVTYYWRVRSFGKFGRSEWTAVRSFTIVLGGYEAEAQRIFTKWHSLGYDAPTEDKDYWNARIKELKDNGVWQKLDVLYNPHAVPTNVNGEALINWIKDDHNGTIVGGVTFTPNVGVQGNGTTGYIRTDFYPSVDGVNYQRDSASMFFYSRNTVSGCACGIFGSVEIYLQSGNQFFGSINAGEWGFSSVPIIDTKRFFSLVRTASNACYFNKTIRKATSTQVSQARSSAEIFLLCRNNGAGVAGIFSTIQLTCFGLGAGLSQNEEMYLRNILEMMIDYKSASVE